MIILVNGSLKAPRTGMTRQGLLDELAAARDTFLTRAADAYDANRAEVAFCFDEIAMSLFHISRMLKDGKPSMADHRGS